MNHPASAPLSEAHAARRLRALRITLAVAVACALALLWLIDHSYERLNQLDIERQNTRIVRSVSDALQDNLTIAASAERGYLRSGSDFYRSRFERTHRRVDELQAQFGKALLATALPAGPSADFQRQVEQKLAALTAAVQAHTGQSANARDPNPMDSPEADSADDALHAAATRLADHIDVLDAANSVAFRRIMNFSHLSFLACVLAVLLAFSLYVQQRYRLREADAERRALLQRDRDQLERDVRARTEDLTELATDLQQIAERERAHLAREFHDELGALMTSAKLDVARIRSRLPESSEKLHERIDHLADTLNQAIVFGRRIVEGLYPASLEKLGLTPALDALIQEFQRDTRLAVDADIAHVALGEARALTLYRVVQEALTNIKRYAQAGHVAIRVREDAGRAHVMVRDDGVGFDLSHLPRGSHGLAGMRHRVRACGGTLRVDSAPGVGTTLSAEIPLDD